MAKAGELEIGLAKHLCNSCLSPRNYTMKNLALNLLFIAASLSLKAQVNANSPVLTMTYGEHSLDLQWDLNREINTSYFVLEKALDGNADFEPIHSTKAQGYQHFSTTYNYEEFSKSSDISYRVVLVLMDGTRVYSNIITLPKSDGELVETRGSIATK